jgi:toxin-antitoxin system PIN domain toxin
VTNPAVLRKAVSVTDAWRQVEDWLSAEAAWVPVPSERHAEVLGELLRLRHMTSRLVPDAHLAALAIEHGLTLCSTDGDFAKFRGLRWENPLT